MTINALVGAGADVTLVCPQYTRGEYATDQVAKLRAYYGTTQDFHVKTVKSVDPEKRGLVKTFHGFSALGVIRAQNPDIVYTRNIQIATIAMAMGYKVAFECYRIFDRNWPSLAKVFGAMTRSKRFLGVITHSGVSAESFYRSGTPSEKVRVVYNGFSVDHMRPVLSREQAREKCQLPKDKFLAIYTGHINPKKGIDELANLAVATPQIQHVWVGGGGDGATNYAEQYRDKVNATNVLLPGWVAPPRLTEYLFAADVLLIPATSTPLQRHGNTVLPMKTYAYLAAGRAILAPDLPDLREVLNHGENAWLIPPNDGQAASTALLNLANDLTLCETLGTAALKSSALYTWDVRAQKIIDFLQERLAA